MPFDLEEKFMLKAEQDLNISKFPSSYREFMMKSNGGFFEIGEDEESDDYIGFYLYPIADTSDKRRLNRTLDNVVKETLYARQNYGLSEEYIQIGDDEGAGIFLFKINEDRTVDENILYRLHEDDNNRAEIVCKFSDHRK